MQGEFDGMPPRMPPRSTVCLWCRQDPCEFECEEVVARYSSDEYRMEDDDGWREFVHARELEHKRVGMPMWGYTPLSRRIETVDTGSVL